MSDLIWLSDAQMRRIERHFPRSHGTPRVDDRRIVSGIKDWRRIHTRYDRCAHTFMSAICIAAAVIFWL
jgi:transposase